MQESSFHGKKNLGYETQRMIHAYYHGHREIPLEQHLYTSVDLLKVYHRTGDRIGGPLEVRSKWSFSLIKPRVYCFLEVESESILASCTVISLPVWYLDVMLQLVPNASLRDPLEKLEGITSLFSGSNIV